MSEKRKTLLVIFICLIIILISTINMRRIVTLSKKEDNIVFYDDFDDIEKDIKGSEVEEPTEIATIEEDKVENIEEIEAVDHLFDTNIDILTRIKNYLGDDKDYTSFIYYNLVTGEEIAFNEDIYMNAASLYKVGLNIVAYDMINNGQITLDELVYYNSWQFQSGTGILQYDTSFGSLPLRTLLEYSIRYSDNIASTMVYSHIGGWNTYKSKLFNLLGIDYGNYDNITSARVELETLKYLYNNKESYTNLIEDLKKTDFHDRLDRYLSYDKVAHKIGSDEGFTHDVGIVFTNEPYIIIMMTDNVYDGPDKIADISKVMYFYNMKTHKLAETTSTNIIMEY